MRKFPNPSSGLPEQRKLRNIGVPLAFRELWQDLASMSALIGPCFTISIYCRLERTGQHTVAQKLYTMFLDVVST